MQAYSPTASAARATGRWHRRLGARWGATTTIRSPFKDRPTFAVTEKQEVLFQNIAAFPDWSEARRARMLGVSPKMVHHNITVWLERGLLRVKSVGVRGVKWLEVRRDWLLKALSPAVVAERIGRWRATQRPARPDVSGIMTRLRSMLALPTGGLEGSI
jgi:hypothetical protein